YYLKTLPSPEVDALRGKKFLNVKGKGISAKASNYKLPVENKGICEILIDLNAENAKDVDITLSNAKGEKVVMNFNPSESKFSFDRTQSGVTDFSKDFPAVVWAPTLRDSKEQKLRIFVDTSSMEVFDAEGNFVLTNLVFPNEPYSQISFSSKGGNARLNSMEIYNIK
ncbi:MAG: GH32 C-terminal domain-containing protein, partial [Muribaculaceae bacterium]|nr:GH32 C-terminal domain-containing protein [Muribaculaceae bacterium]